VPQREPIQPLGQVHTLGEVQFPPFWHGEEHTAFKNYY